jgi:histidyl-tRNA synthetase
MTLQPARGTQDLLPETTRRHRRVSETARKLAALYGFAEIATPVFEFTEVFARPIGEHTDIVSKEMYTFTDRGGEELTLRPENTAGVVRAVLSNGLTQQTPLKFFYSGPMFRYERPQKGRFRQFHQIGVELLGVPQPQADVEVIALGQRILQDLGIGNRVVLKLNTLGDPEDRQRYRNALRDYLSAHITKLSDDSRRRLERNPLRILDSKDPEDQRICAAAPTFEAHLSASSYEFFKEVQNGLSLLGIRLEVDPGQNQRLIRPGLNYTGPDEGVEDEDHADANPVPQLDTGLNGNRELDPRLVRGLDYYAHTVFEFVTTDLGAQGTVLAGGRYDGLVELMGGPAMPGVGWAGGIERLAMMIAEPPTPPRPIIVIPIGEDSEPMALTIAEVLRNNDCHVELSYSGNLSRRMRYANRIKARAAVLIGEAERARNVVKLRDLDSGDESEVPMDLSLGELRSRLKALDG